MMRTTYAKSLPAMKPVATSRMICPKPASDGQNVIKEELIK